MPDDPRIPPLPPMGAPGPPPQGTPPPRRPPVDPSVVQLGQLMAVLGQDPQYRGRILELIHEAAPTVPIPELDVAKATQKRLDEATTPLRDENKQLAERLGKLEGALSQRDWMDTNGVDGEEMTAVQALAKEKKIGDPDTALDYYRRAQLGRPRGSVPAAMTTESRQELYKNPKAWYEREATKVLNESRRRRQSA